MTTSLRLEAVDKLIAITEIDKKKLQLLRRRIRLQASICAASTAPNPDLVEIARLKRNLVTNELDGANLDIDIARFTTELREVLDAIAAEERAGADDWLRTLFDKLAGDSSGFASMMFENDSGRLDDAGFPGFSLFGTGSGIGR